MKALADKVHLCSELVKVVVNSKDGQSTTSIANLEEISESQLELNSEQFLEVGSRVEIHCEFHILKGVVETAATDAVLGHIVRVRLDVESQWSEKLFTPQHLFALWKHVEEPEGSSKHGQAA